jgi:hypothetical protein
VTTSKLANKAVTLAKLAAGARVPGPRGQKGDPGPKGDSGQAGPSDAYVDTNDGPVSLPATTDVRVATVRVPEAGKYVIWAKATLHADPAHTQLTSSACRLGTGQATDALTDVSWSFVAPGAEQTVANVTTNQFDGPTSVNFYCVVSGLSDVSGIKLVAIKVGTLTTSTG